VLGVGWSDWLSTCGATATVSFVIGDYSGALFPALKGRTVPVALAFIIFFALLQWRGIRWGGAVQNLTSLLKCLAFASLIIACFALGVGSRPAERNSINLPHGLALLLPVVLSLQAVIYTMMVGPVSAISQKKSSDPNAASRAIFGGVLLVLAIYLLVNLALVYVLPLSKIAGQDLAVGAAAQTIFGASGDRHTGSSV
jgi:APA family basic amino acid/polyamine antiporter